MKSEESTKVFPDGTDEVVPKRSESGPFEA